MEVVDIRRLRDEVLDPLTDGYLLFHVTYKEPRRIVNDASFGLIEQRFSLGDIRLFVRLIEQLVEAHAEEVHVHDFDNRSHARHGGTHLDSDGEVVLAGIVNMAHELKRAVVAEGVESEADAQLLAKIGCEFGQGYYFSPPLDGAAALEYIAKHYNIAAELG